MQTPITYVYGLTLLPHMQNSAQKEWVQMLRWLAMRCNSKLQIRARMWKRKSEVAGMSANLSRSPSGQEAFSSWNCNLHIIFRSALQQKKNWNSSPTPSKKKKNTLQILQTWSSWFFKRERERVSCIIFKSIKGSWPQSFIRKKNSLVWVCFSIQCNAHQDGVFLNL